VTLNLGLRRFLHGAEGIFIVVKGRSNELDANNWF
jgi:hypothetical protein